MVRLIMGEKGTVKTKRLIEMINEASVQESGNVICIEPDATMTYDIHYKIRLVNAKEHALASFEALRGFISGLYAGNYDISYIFLDNLCKIVPCDDFHEVSRFLTWLDQFGAKTGVKFCATISGSESLATEEMRRYL